MQQVNAVNFWYGRMLHSILLALFLWSTSVVASPDAAGGLTYSWIHAYTKHPVDSPSASTAYTVRFSDLADGEGIATVVRQSLQATAAMPAGRKALLNFDFDFLQLSQSIVTQADSSSRPLSGLDLAGMVVPDKGVWLGQTVERVAERLDAFFSAYRDAGGQLDLVALDYRGLDFSYETLTQLAANNGGMGAHLQAIQEDQRFAALSDLLGFSDLSIMLGDDQDARQARKQWNAVMQQRVAAYLNHAVYKPVHHYFPNADVIGRDFFEQKSGVSVASHKFGKTAGASVGTAQAKTLGRIDDFASFQKAINQLRSATLASDKPVFPFIEGASHAHAGTWHREVLLHAALNDAGQFVYLNDNEKEDTDVVSVSPNGLVAVLNDLDVKTSGAKLHSLTDNLAHSSDVFVLSRAKIVSETGNDRYLMRFTPKLAEGQSLAAAVLRTEPAQFVVNDTVITLPGARVMDTSLDGLSVQSEVGVWLEAIQNPVSLTTDACSDSLSAGDSCLAVYAGGLQTESPALIMQSPVTANLAAADKQVLFKRNWRRGGWGYGLERQDGFAADYQVAVNVQEGDYRFVVNADDHVRVWLGDQLIIDASGTQRAYRELSAVRHLSAGVHQIRFEYKDIVGRAQAELSIQREVYADDCQINHGMDACIAFFDQDGNALSLPQQVVMTTNGLQFDARLFNFPEGIVANNIIMRWNGLMHARETGQYAFDIAHGGGGRIAVRLDDQLLYQGDVEQIKTVQKHLQQGEHQLHVELHVTIESFFKLNWSLLSVDEKIQTALPTDMFFAEYFENTRLEGEPAYTETVDVIDKDWGRGALGEGLISDGFSARWTGEFFFEEGSYTFRPVTDDGVRLWVDGHLLVDFWRNQSARERPAGIRLTRGYHVIKMEYYENTGYAVARLNWEQDVGCQSIPEDAFCGEFFNNTTLSSPVAWVSNSNDIAFEWGKTSPNEGVVSEDRFSARWLGDFTFEEGDYNLNIYTDDGMRVWVGDIKVFDSWDRGGRFLETFNVAAGKHRVVVEYREWGGNARAHVNWVKADPCLAIPENQFCGEYFSNRDLDGWPVYNHSTETIAFDWGKDSPVPGVIAEDHFSARWQGDFTFEEGDYNLNLYTDDGVRVWIGDTKVFDSWDRGGRFLETFNVAAGKHRVVVEYREWGGNARAHVNWVKADPCLAIPENQFCGEYFSNRDLNGWPVYNQPTETVTFDWGKDSPVPGVIAEDHFSIRWQGDFVLEGGSYNFTAVTDDGVRVWVGDAEEPLIDSWDRGGAFHETLDIPEGKHRIKVEYREWGGNARARVGWSKGESCPQGVPDEAFCGEYYPNKTHAGLPTLARTDEEIAFDWEFDSPDIERIPGDQFSSRWRGYFNLSEGDYRFVARADDSVKLWINEEQIINEPRYNGNVEYFYDVSLNRGRHLVRMDTHDNGGRARAHLFWEKKSDCTGVPKNKFCGSYYQGTELEGEVVRTARTDNIDFVWGEQRPMHGVPDNNYSVRWLGRFDFEEGYYNFSGQVDDGIRVWINDRLILDQWNQNARFNNRVSVTPWVGAGEHTIKVEYRERYGDAQIQFNWQPVEACQVIPEDGYCVEYFNNRTLEGIPTVVEKVNSIANDWGYEAPHELVWNDSFSARWKRRYFFEAGNYRFETSTDDGVKLFIDGVEVISQWHNQPEKSYQRIVTLERGWHELQIEYYDAGGLAAAHFNWQSVPSCEVLPENRFCGVYFNTNDLTGEQVDIQLTDAINFDWLKDAPNQYVKRDQFSARWVGVFDFDGGLYRFLTDFDDRMRVKVNGELVIDGWERTRPYYGALRKLHRLPAGQHTVEVEYAEQWGDARAKLWWEKAPDCEVVPQGEYCAEFFDGIDLNSEQLLDTRSDSSINFDWEGGEPYPGANVPRDRFSVRWQGRFDFLEGEYTFNVRSDDGFRLWLDDTLLIDAWRLQGVTDYNTSVLVSAGEHNIKAEYFENGGLAVAKMNWQIDQAEIPRTPANLSAESVTQEQVTLTWDTQRLVDHYRVIRDGIVLGTVDVPSFTDNAVVVPQTHTYQIIAVWPNGRESLPAELEVGIPDTTPPTEPTELRVLDVSPSSVTLRWSIASDNVGVAGYKVFRDGELLTQVVAPGLVDEGLDNFSQHSYYVVALDAAGNLSPHSSQLTVFTRDDASPSVPANLSARVIRSSGYVRLRWDASIDNVSVARYWVMRNGQRIGQTRYSQFTDKTAVENTSYEYQIIAIDSSRNRSAPSTSVSVISGDVTAPSAPQGLSAEVFSGNAIDLTWQSSTDDRGVDHYKILRDGRFLSVSSVTAYRDETVEEGYTYQYSVKAVDEAGNVSIASDVVEKGLSEICDSTVLYYQQHVKNMLASNCATCHVAGGMAQASRFTLVNGGLNGASERNLHTLNALNQMLGKRYILEKAAGEITHGGGVALARRSMEWRSLSELLSSLDEPQQCVDEGLDEIPLNSSSLVQNCASCHGSDGRSAGPATPTIAGFSKTYLESVMEDYKTGMRRSTVMNRIARGYSSNDIEQIAEILATKPYVVALQSTQADLVNRGQVLHQQYCASCHAASGRDSTLTGVYLAGQWKPYIQRTLQDYAVGSSVMPSGMKTQLDAMYAIEGDDGIVALSEFYASIPQDSEPPERADDLALAAYTHNSITLTWTDADDDWGIAYYEIYRDGVLVGKSQFNTFTDVGLANGNYTYTVVAVDIAGNRSVVSRKLETALTAEQFAQEGVQLLDYSATLRKASLLLLGRLPSAEEMSQVSDEETFRSTLREMFSTNGALDDFVYRAGHEVFLSRGAARAGSGDGIRSDDFPMLDGLSATERRVVQNAIKEEPVYLLQHIVDKDRPWTEVLTADYTVLNPQLAKALGATPLQPFSDETNANERQPAEIPQVSARLPNKAFPHAGVLTTNAWLSRFPTTDTNRNRHRSSQVFRQFMAVDIEALAQRPLDDSNNSDYLVPTMENPNCMVCHTAMEPVAGAFRNWGDDNRYAQNFRGDLDHLDSLDRSYKSDSYPLNHLGQPWYHQGDQWYRDMFMPGMNNKLMPGGYAAFDGETSIRSGNLLTNPGAEEGITGWQVATGSLSATNADTCGRVTAQAHSGNAFFQLSACEQEIDQVQASQMIDVSEFASQIDRGRVSASFGAQFRTLQRRDVPSVKVSFFDENNAVIQQADTLQHTNSYRWQSVTGEQSVPRNTRFIHFVLRGDRSASRWADPYLDAYIDDAFLTVTTSARDVVRDDSTDALQWLARQLVQDQRFAKGGVHFWYRALFKRAPLTAPVNPEMDGYATAMAAYNEQDVLLAELAERFSRDRGNGAWNVKDLLIDLVSSSLFRAQEGFLNEQEQALVNDLGLARILTPEELNRKLKATTGHEWRSFSQDRVWSDRMGLFYGGFDGGSLQNSPNIDMNGMMSKIPDRMAIELSCNIVRDEFRLTPIRRTLFQRVAASDTPASEDVEFAETNMLINPGAEDGLNGWTIDEGTIRVLSGERGCNGGPSIKTGTAIFNPGSICENQTALGRVYQDISVSAWNEQIDSGSTRALFGAALRAWSNNNDEASVLLRFFNADGDVISDSQILKSRKGYWESSAAFVDVPSGTRVIRFYMQGERIASNQNNDSFVDDTYLRLLLPDSDYMPAGERRIRETMQFLHQHLLNESLDINDPELDRTFQLFSDVWAERSEGTETSSCRLYSDWEDPHYTKRAWSLVLMYLLTDARFLHE